MERTLPKLICTLPVLIIGGPVLMSAVVLVYLLSFGGENALAIAVATPGLLMASWLSFSTAVLSTLVSIVITCLLLVGNRRLNLQWAVGTAHIAVAVAVMMIWSSSGLWGHWAVASGWFEQAPSWPGVRDSQGLMMSWALVLKETVFLYLLMQSSLQRADLQRQQLAESLGLSSGMAWLRVVFPQLLRRNRYAIWLVIGFSATQVEVASVLGPQRPPTLSMIILHHLQDAQLASAAVAAWLIGILLLVTAAAIVVTDLSLNGFSRLIARLQWRKNSGFASMLAAALTRFFRWHWLLAMVMLLALSLSRRWPGGAWLVQGFSLRSFERLWQGEAVFNTLFLGLLSSALGLLLSIGVLMAGWRFAGAARIMVMSALAIPGLLLFLGLLYLQIWVFNGHYAVLLWGHLLLVLPYQLLLLEPQWRRFDDDFLQLGASLGLGPVAGLFRIRLPIMLPSVLIVFAMGFSVSVAQYLSTLLLGQGRVSTLGVEAVIAAGSGNRPQLAATSLVLAVLPALLIALCDAYPRWRFRRRQGMQYVEV